MIQIQFDPEGDALYVALEDSDGEVESEQLDEFRIIDYDEDGSPVGVEFLFVSRGLDLTGIPHADRIAAAIRAFPQLNAA